MAKNKRAAPKKNTPSPEEREQELIRNLTELTLFLAQTESKAHLQSLQDNQHEFQKTIRKCLVQKKDAILYEALEQTREASEQAYQLLKESIEEAAEIVLFRREDGTELEVNAFVIPVFVHIKGGLLHEQSFQDQQAFELLRKSFKDAGLESQDAQVVLVSHAYHPDEINRISYSELNEMVRNAYAAMTSKKAVATPAIDRSISGWPDRHFDAEDLAVELRFLLGFALKRVDDPFYQVPENETAADQYFATRAARFQQWTQQFAPLVKACLVTDTREADIHFLYQDLFHGGKEAGNEEYFTLEMMSELHHELQAQGVAPEQADAVIGVVEAEGEFALQVNVLARTGQTLLASAEKPLGVSADLENDIADLADALKTMGIASVSVTAELDAQGDMPEPRPQ